MTLEEKIRNYRKQSGMSQEKMAEKIGVSRQAITKWENGTGVPDISNLIAIAELFQVSVDELLSNEKAEKKQSDFLYESVTEYDIDGNKHYDIKLGGANLVVVNGCEGEKLQVRLVSNTIQSLQSDYKVKIDDNKKAIDIDVKRMNGATEAAAKDGVSVMIQLPKKYIHKVEVAVNAKQIKLQNISCDSLEIDGKVSELILDACSGDFEINSNLDMTVTVESHAGYLALNQVSATSKLYVAKDYAFRAVKKGIATMISYEENGKTTTDFSNEEAENIIELNGMKSELIIATR